MLDVNEVHNQIESIVKSNRIVLFMKGTRTQPQCGFSAATIGILDTLVPDYATVNVLENQDIREGVKSFSEWPTIPQLYIDGEFQGGCDLVREMYNAGELHEALGIEPPDRTPPAIEITDDAAEMIRSALEDNPGMAVHLSIDAQWSHNFGLGQATGGEIAAVANGIDIMVDIETARRADGMRIDVTESFQGKSLNVDNPNMPPPVQEMSPAELKALQASDTPFKLYDVREQSERDQASIEGSTLLDESAVNEIQGSAKDTMLVFFCHHGQRSQSAANHFRLQGFANVHNVTGGIDAWSRDVDSSTPRY